MDPSAELAKHGILGTLLLIAMGVIVVLYRERVKATTDYITDLKKQQSDYLVDLKAEHAARLTDKDKATQAILEQTNKSHDLLDRMADIFEQTTGRKIPP